MNVEKVLNNTLEFDVSKHIENPSNVQIGKLVRSLKAGEIKSIDKIAHLVYMGIAAQERDGIFPYNRYMKNGSGVVSAVVSNNRTERKDCIVWSSNHYLGLNRHPDVINYAVKILQENGTGCGTSAVSGGFSSVHKELERELASLCGKPEAVLFATGYTTNLGTISSLAGKGDLILIDRDIHASIIDGSIMSKADLRIFKHNDPYHLEKLLKSAREKKYNNIFVITESVFSMTGEEAPLLDYCRLKEKYGFLLYVDEAHSFGFYGNKGAGFCDHIGCSGKVDFFMSTLSKATASVGGFIGSEKHYCSYLRVNSNPYLFQACLTPVDAAVTVAALKVIRTDGSIAKRLWNNTRLFRRLLVERGFFVGKGTSPIVPLFVSDEAKLSVLCKRLFENNIFTNWVSYPVVPRKKGRLRFLVTASHTEEQIGRTVSVLTKLSDEIGIIRNG